MKSWMLLAATVLTVVAGALLIMAQANADGVSCSPGEPARIGVNADGSTYNSCGGAGLAHHP